MKETKELLFAGLGSLIVIVGLAYLKVFGLNLSYTPLLATGVLVSIFALKNSEGANWLLILVVALAGLLAGVALQQNPQVTQLSSPATGFALALALPAVMVKLRKLMINEK